MYICSQYFFICWRSSVYCPCQNIAVDIWMQEGLLNLKLHIWKHTLNPERVKCQSQNDVKKKLKWGGGVGGVGGGWWYLVERGESATE